MNLSKGIKYFFDFKVTERVGLRRILDPKTTCKLYGYNVYHAVIMSFVLYLFVVSTLGSIGFYYTTNNMIMFTLCMGCVTNFLFSCYKMMHVVVHSKYIWECMDVTRFDFMSYRHYDKNIFEHWRHRTVRTLSLYIVIIFFTLLIWTSIPLVFSSTLMEIKNTEGSHSFYRMNIFNIYLTVSDETYNNHFNAFYFIEIIVILCFLYFSMIYDSIMVTMCFALSGQLETITNAVKLLGYKRPNEICLGTC